MNFHERLAKLKEEEEQLGKLCRRCFARYRGQVCDSMTCQARNRFANRSGIGVIGCQSSPQEFELDTTIGDCTTHGYGGTLQHGTGGGNRVVRSTRGLS